MTTTNPITIDPKTREILEQTPEKVLPFLRALATRVEIRAALASCGYTEEEQEYAWKLLLSASGYVPVAMPATADERARAAIAELDVWDEQGFGRIHAALGRLHPEQDAFVFAGIEPGQGMDSVVSVATLLDRLDALEKPRDGQAPREGDRAAIATLEKRGITVAQRAHLRELVRIAQTASVPATETEATQTSEQRDKALGDLHAWYQDWSATARAVIRRRDHLILMGLGKRRRAKKEEPPAVEPSTPGTVPPVVTPAPVVTPSSLAMGV